MIYKLIVNAAFLAIGYYIGKQVGLSERIHGKPAQAGEPARTSAGKATSNRTTDNSGG
jgi:hypothetical protein